MQRKLVQDSGRRVSRMGKKVKIGEGYSKAYLDLLAHHLSRIKYQIELAIGSTIASVRAIINDTSATNIKTVIAIQKWTDGINNRS